MPLVEVLSGVSLSFVIRYEGKADQSQRSRASFEAGGWMMSHFSSDGSVSPGSMLVGLRTDSVVVHVAQLSELPSPRLKPWFDARGPREFGTDAPDPHPSRPQIRLSL